MSRSPSAILPEYLARRLAAQRSDRWIQATCLIAALGCLVAAAMILPSLNVLRKKYQLEIDPAAIGTLPPDIALLTQTGTFRALAIDLGFVRLEQLKEEGRFYELMQLSSWLCKLAPRYASVWSYNAWNQAYNISVCEYTPEGRWLWVSNGIRLLRDEGIRYNPKTVGLYKDLAFIYWHKIGDILDDYHMQYKRELAVEMERVLGAKPPTLTEQDELDWFRKIVDARRDFPKILTDDAEVAAFVDRLREVGLEPDETLLEFVAHYLRPDVRPAALLKAAADDAGRELLEKRLQVVGDEATAAARERLLAGLRSHVLRTKYKFDLDWMISLMEKYGPIDWRTPYAHALYWASYGDMVCKGKLNLDSADAMNTGRFIFFALHNMVRQGRLVLEPNWDQPNRSFVEFLPDPRFIDHLHQTYLEIGKEQFGHDERFREGTSGPNYWVGHVNFLRQAITELYFEGTEKSIAKANGYYHYLTRYDTDDEGKTKPQYLVPLEKFVLQDLYDALQTSKATSLFVGGFINRSLYEQALGNLDAAVGFLEVAKKAYDFYMKGMRGDPQARRELEPLKIIYRDCVVRFMQRPDRALYQKVRLWQALDLTIRQHTYETLQPYFVELCERHDPPLDVDRAFRAPPGWDKAAEQPMKTRERERNASEGTKDFEP
jgi:hypothetical protein